VKYDLDIESVNPSNVVVMLSEINAALPPSELLHGASDVNMTTAIGIFDWTDTVPSIQMAQNLFTELIIFV
jgi:hypothetical protein